MFGARQKAIGYILDQCSQLQADRALLDHLDRLLPDVDIVVLAQINDRILWKKSNLRDSESKSSKIQLSLEQIVENCK